MKAQNLQYLFQALRFMFSESGYMGNTKFVGMLFEKKMERLML